MQDGHPIDPAKFLAEAKAARQRGICIISGIVDDFATCLAAPVLNPAGRCIGCICFIVSSSLGREKIEELTRLLMESGGSSQARRRIPPSSLKRSAASHGKD